MNKLSRILVCFLCIILLFVYTSCSFDSDSFGENSLPIGDNFKYTVTFHPNNGESNTTAEAYHGSTCPKQPDPKKDGSIFIGWYSNESLTIPFSFSSSINSNMDVYAKYMTDYVSLTNEIMLNTMHSNVTILTTSFNTVLGIGGSSSKSGSGIIIYKSDSTYYALTNNHVVSVAAGYAKAQYEVEDCYGTKFSASVLCADSAYDLALVCFRANAEKYPVVPFADSNPEVSQEIVAIGQPGGQGNTLTYGTIGSYQIVTITEKDSSSAIEFESICHSAPIANGSSGGAVLDTSLRLVGINYGGAYDDEHNFVYGAAIPIYKVKEFLNNHHYLSDDGTFTVSKK